MSCDYGIERCDRRAFVSLSVCSVREARAGSGGPRGRCLPKMPLRGVAESTLNTPNALKLFLFLCYLKAMIKIYSKISLSVSAPASLSLRFFVAMR